MSNFIKLPKTKEEYISLSVEQRKILRNSPMSKFPFYGDWLKSCGVDEETIKLMIQEKAND